ncbi:MAG: hypothetical protein ACXVJW_12945 [Acidimicrobiia bacterium]
MKVLSAVTISGAALLLGANSITAATQGADNAAASKAKNEAATIQSADQSQQAWSDSGNSGCGDYCAGGGGNITPQDQSLGQDASTSQGAQSEAVAKQNTENVNAPTSVEGDHHHGMSDGSDHSWGSSDRWGGGSASLDATNSASSRAGNLAFTGQDASQSQSSDSSSGNSGCGSYCTGGGGNITPQTQGLDQTASTDQWSDSTAKANQDALNVNSPTNIGGHSTGSGDGSANLNASNDASSKAKNAAATVQDATQDQQASSSSGNSGCTSYCTGGGGNITPQDQSLNQNANTSQDAESLAKAKQQILNVNVPITIVGWGSVGSSGGSAELVAFNNAGSSAKNAAATDQSASQGQSASSSSGNSGCASYCTGGGGNITPQDQSLNQSADTTQWASSDALAKQEILNVNVPVTIVGWGSVGSAGGSASVDASNSSSSSARNAALTTQDASQGQNATSSSGNTGCTSYCTGGGGNITPQSQSTSQTAGTTQGASSLGAAHQGASNTSSPVLVG